MPKKSHNWGFKLWGRSDSDGFMYDFDVYQPVPDDQVSELGRSTGVVEKMTDSLPDGKNFKAFADNYFSSAGNLKKRRQIYYIGTVKMNRVTVGTAEQGGGWGALATPPPNNFSYISDFNIAQIALFFA